jgi:hypothetical protein
MALPELAVTERESNSSTICWSSIARSFIDCNRWSGFFDRQRLISRRSSAGTSGLIASTGCGLSCTILCIVSKVESAWNGHVRVAAS